MPCREVFALASIRFRFIRGEEVKYISHLDTMRTFERALRRADIPVAYSQGFNPHPLLIFGLPLSVGVTSEAEYADIELAESMDPRVFAGTLNSKLPAGLKIAEAREKFNGANIMASVALASYRIELLYTYKSIGIPEAQALIHAFLGQHEIFVDKHGKKGIQRVDIRQMIKNVELLSGAGNLENRLCIKADLSAGSKANLKPELMIPAFNKVAGEEAEIALIHRMQLYVKKGEKLYIPLEDAVLR